MELRNSARWLVGVGLATGLALGGAGNAFAQAGIFTVDPDLDPNTNNSFTSNSITGTPSSLLTLNADNTVDGSGYIDIGSFVSPGGGNVLSGISRLGVDYQLWVEFDYTTSLVSGTFGAAGSQYDVTSLTFELFRSEGLTTSFTQADASGPSPAVVNVGANPAQLVGFGSLVQGTASFNNGGDADPNTIGAAFNAQTTYQNTAFGSTFFTDPDPFFNVSFNQFNNTAQGLDRNGNIISLNQTTGSIDFNRVPEPATLGLLGLGLIGLGAGAIRRRYHG